MALLCCSVAWAQGIGDSAFEGCVSLSTIKIIDKSDGKSVFCTGQNAFKGCESLEVIDIPLSAKLAKGSFMDCTNLSQFWVKHTDSYDGTIFANCEKLEYLGTDEFYKDENAPNYLFDGMVVFAGTNRTVMNNDVYAIGAYAFSGRKNLEKIELPGSIINIGANAFENCTGLKEFKVNWDTPLPVSANIFEGVNLTENKAVLYCPEGSVEKYKAADVWKDFYEIKVDNASGIHDVTVEKRNGSIMYNLCGQRIYGKAKGIIIENGKKVMVK